MEIILLDNCKDASELIIKCGNSESKLQELKKLFYQELFEFETSRMIAKQQNEKSLDYYIGEQRNFDRKEKMIKEALEKIKE